MEKRTSGYNPMPEGTPCPKAPPAPPRPAPVRIELTSPHAHRCPLCQGNGFAHDSGIARIAAERRRQVEKEGWTPEHDAQHRKGELLILAFCYAMPGERDEVLRHPWAKREGYPNPTDRDLEKAGALIAAERDRRAWARAKEAAGGEE